MSDFEKIARAFGRKKFWKRQYVPLIITLWAVVIFGAIALATCSESRIEPFWIIVLVVALALFPFTVVNLFIWYYRHLTYGYELYEYSFEGLSSNDVIQVLACQFSSGRYRPQHIVEGAVYCSPTHYEVVNCHGESRGDGQIVILGHAYRFEVVALWRLVAPVEDLRKVLVNGTLWGVANAGCQEHWRRIITCHSRAQFRDGDFTREQVRAGLENIAKMLSMHAREDSELFERIELVALSATFIPELAAEAGVWSCAAEIE